MYIQFDEITIIFIQSQSIVEKKIKWTSHLLSHDSEVSAVDCSISGIKVGLSCVKGLYPSSVVLTVWSV